MAIIAFFFVLFALGAVGGRFFVRRTLRKRSDRRQKLFNIAAGKLDGVDLKLPPMPGRKPPVRKGWLPSSTVWSFGRDEHENQPKGEQRQHFQLLPEKVDRLLKAQAAMRETVQRLLEAEKQFAELEAKSPAEPLADPKFGKWWPETTNLLRDKRVAARRYERANALYAPVLKDLRSRLDEIGKLLSASKEKDMSFLNDEATLALESAERITGEISWWDNPNVPTPAPSEYVAEPEQPNTEAEELCARLPELVQALLTATMNAAKLHERVANLRSRVENERTASIQLKEPRRPVEPEVNQFVNGALNWVKGLPALESEFDAALASLKETMAEADRISAELHSVITQLNAFEQFTAIIYEDELPKPEPPPVMPRFGFSGLGASQARVGAPSLVGFAQSGAGKSSWLGSAAGGDRQWPPRNGADPDENKTSPAAAPELGKVAPFQHAKFEPGKFQPAWSTFGGYQSGTKTTFRPPPKPIVEPPYEKPEAPRVRKRWFITDYAEAMREAARMAEAAAEEKVLRQIRRDGLRDLWRPEEPVRQTALEDEDEKRAAIVAGLRKIGFAVAQWHAAEDKLQAHKQWQQPSISGPAIDNVGDINSFVQAVASWQAQSQRQRDEAVEHQDQTTALSKQVRQRKRQLEDACRVVAQSLDEMSLFESDVPESFVLPMKAAKLVINHYSPSLRYETMGRQERWDLREKQRRADECNYY